MAFNPTIARLEQTRRELLDQRCQTAGHGRRARIQEQIDQIDRELLALHTSVACPICHIPDAYGDKGCDNCGAIPGIDPATVEAND